MPNNRGRVQNGRSVRASEKVVGRHHQGIRSNPVSASDYTFTSTDNEPRFRWHRRLRPLLLALGIPFGVLATNNVEASAGFFGDMKKVGENTAEGFSEMRDFFSTLKGYLEATVDFVINIRENVATISADVMTWTYETLTKVVLHTPSFLFDSEWLRENTIMFTGLSLVVTVCIALYEGFQRMISGVHETKGITNINKVYARLPFVIGISAVAPTLFYYGFTALNWATEKIINLASIQMQEGLANINTSTFTLLEVGMFVLFDIALIGVMIPVFLQNFRRWFELLVLASITPLALSCWMFDSKEHLFHLWWDSIKKRATVQLVYAVYLLFIGGLMFGTKLPEDNWDLLIKLGVMIGGLFSMVNPPQIIKSHLNYHANTREVLQGAKDSFVPPEETREKAKGGYRFLRLKYLVNKRKKRAINKK